MYNQFSKAIDAFENKYLKLYPKIEAEIFKILSNPNSFNNSQDEVVKHFELFQSLMGFSFESDHVSNGTYLNSIISFVYQKDHSNPHPLAWAFDIELSPEASKELLAMMDTIEVLEKINLSIDVAAYELSQGEPQFPERHTLCRTSRKDAGLTAKEWSEHLEGFTTKP